jgi:cytochrome c1
MNPVMYQRIIADFDAALAQKGYEKADTGDLSMAVTIGAQQKTDIETWGRFGLQTSVYQYTQGQLSLDVFDTKTKQALWHGQVSDTVNPDKPNPAKVDSAIAKLMQDFPATAAVVPAPAQ